MGRLVLEVDADPPVDAVPVRLVLKDGKFVHDDIVPNLGDFEPFCAHSSALNVRLGTFSRLGHGR